MLIQIYLPLSYYVMKGDEFDERFAWRMFSYTHMGYKTVDFSVKLGNSEMIVDKKDFFSDKTIRLIDMGRSCVLNKVCIFFCDLDPNLEKVIYTLTYSPWDGDMIYITGETDCNTRKSYQK